MPLRLGLTPWNFTDATAAALTEQAAFAESLGYDSFWLPENHFNPNAIPDPLMLLAGVAAGTRTMKLATTSYLVPLRNPLLAAEQVAVLDRLSGGRVLLGVGRGYSTETLRAFDIEPGEKRERFEWALEKMLQAWAGEPVSLHEDGSNPVEVRPLPVQRPHPPVWVAAFGPKALRQAGRLGLPYLASPIDPFEALRANYARYDQALEDAGHAPAATRPLMRAVFASEDAREVAAMREHLATTKLPRGLTLAPEIDDWAVIGAPGYVRDRLAAVRESVRASHLVVTHFRMDALGAAPLRASVERIAGLFA